MREGVGSLSNLVYNDYIVCSMRAGGDFPSGLDLQA